MPRPKKPNLKDRPAGGDGPMFLRYGEEGPDLAVASQCLEEAGGVFHAEARDRFAGIEPGISVREGMDNFNWEFFRPGDRLPRRKNEIIQACDNVYRYEGLIRFTIQMMADFVCQGMEIYHPAASKEKRYRHWWKKVGGRQVSSHLVNHLFRHGTAIVKRNFSVLNAGDIRDLETGVGAVPVPGDDEKTRVERDVKYQRSARPGRNRIPMKYTFLNPRTVDVVGGELAIFAGEPKYGLRIPDALFKTIQNARTTEERLIVANLPSYITDMVGAGQKIIPLDPDKVSVLHYQKDDWMLWGDPLILSILRDVLLYEKMKDADKAALDGSIRNIRLWKLGLPDHKIQPGPGAFKKLRDQLLANVGGGSMDLIWDAAIDLQETSTDVHKFLGSAKYEPVLQAIYAGLGIPQSLTGGAGGGGGMTNNALSLKTLIERLEYARNVLVDFWEKEFYLIQQAFGDRQPARLRFDLMTLSDEASEKMLWINLFDRDIVSAQTMMEKFGQLWEIEVARIRREYKLRESGDMPYKTGPFTEAAPHPDGLAKAAMQQGTIAPTEAGVKKKPKARGDKSLLDHQNEQQDKQLDLQKEQMEAEQKLAEKQQKIDEKQGSELHQQKLAQNDDLHKQRLGQKDAEHKAMLPVKKQAMKQALKAKAKGQPGQGRPTGKKDASQRKQRAPKPRTSAASLFSAQAQARTALRVIADAVTPAFLEGCGRKNVRSLTAGQAAELESLKFRVLCLASPSGPVTAESAIAAMRDPSPAPRAAEAALSSLLDGAFASRGVTPTVEDLRETQAAAYATFLTEQDDGEA